MIEHLQEMLKEYNLAVIGTMIHPKDTKEYFDAIMREKDLWRDIEEEVRILKTHRPKMAKVKEMFPNG